MKLLKLAILILTVMFLFDSPPFAADDDFMAETLRGLDGVGVFCTVSDDLATAGLIQQQVQEDIELRLLANGIRMLSQEELKKGKGRPSLIVYVLGAGQGKGYVYAIRIDLFQRVYLDRNHESAYVPTWNWLIYGVTNNPELIKGKVKDALEIFIKAYLSVNPKK